MASQLERNMIETNETAASISLGTDPEIFVCG